MRFRKRAIISVNIVTLVLAACAHGAPTAAVRDNAALIHATCAGSCTGTASVPVSEIFPAAGAHNWNLTRIADEILKPPADFSVGSTSSAQVTALPAVPSAVFMVLTGFVCVSVVKDRKVWIAVLAGLLWAGQIGKEMLVARCSQLVKPANLRNAILDPRCPMLAIRKTHSFDEYQVSGIEHPYIKRHTTYNIRNTIHDSRFWTSSSRERNHSASIEYLVSSIPIIYEETNRLAYIDRWHFYFSPAFIFSLLARGPPE